MRRMFAVCLLLMLSPCIVLAITREEKQREIAEALFKVSKKDGILLYGYNDYRECLIIERIDYCEKAEKGAENGYLGGHSGDDYGASYRGDAPFYSLTDGIVININDHNDEDNNSIAIFDGVNTIVYLHASSISPSIREKAITKDAVRRHEKLGNQGEEGFATGPHVHVEVRKGEAKLASLGACASVNHPNIDPVPYLYGWVTDGRAGEVIPYDVNDDERVDWADVFLVYYGMGTNNFRYDVNCDIQIDWLDVIAVYENLEVIAAPAARLSLADQTSLFSNYPNPFNPETWIPYSLAEAAEVTLAIYDINGTEVRRFDLGHQAAGLYIDRRKSIYWDGRNMLGEKVAGGAYFYYLQAGNYSATRRMVILK